MKQIFKTFDKNKINALPQILFDGRIIVVVAPEETEAAVDYLLGQEILGVDTETRPSFVKGHRYEVSLLQVSTLDTCFLFRLNHTGITPAIKRLLEDRTVPKIGLSWHDDLCQLHRRAEFEPGYFVELQNVAANMGIADKSLQKLYANLFGKRICKGQRLSNWEKDELRESQLLYAATDAWTCIHLYREMERLKNTGDYILVEPEPKEATPEVEENKNEPEESQNHPEASKDHPEESKGEAAASIAVQE